MSSSIVVTDLDRDASLVRRQSYGTIEAAGGTFEQLSFRRWPKFVWLPEQRLLGGWLHRRRTEDRCRLYYDQPRRFPGFLAVKYIQSGQGTSLATVLAALAALEQVARLKQSDALLCDVANPRITPRVMQRFGWEPHAPSLWHHNYIRRYYGNYEPTTLRAAATTAMLQEEHAAV